MRRLAIQGFKIHPGQASAKGDQCLVDIFVLAMGDGDTISDTSTSQLLPLKENFKQRFWIQLYREIAGWLDPPARRVVAIELPDSESHPVRLVAADLWRQHHDDFAARLGALLARAAQIAHLHRAKA